MRYILPVHIRWSDIDANGHLRHSVYYDWGAYCRIHFLQENGLGTTLMQELCIGPVIFREEAVFRKEILQENRVTIDMELTKARRDFSRFSLRHTITKNDNDISAIINLDGAWMDTAKRKLSTPPELVKNAHEQMVKSFDFEWLN